MKTIVQHTAVTLNAQHSRPSAVARPPHEGANIGTWIGFRHLMNMVDGCVIQWFRDQEMGPQRLYDEYGLELKIIDTSTLLPALVQLDDSIISEVRLKANGEFSVKLFAERGGSTSPVARGAVRAVLTRASDVPEKKPAPPHMTPFKAAAMATPSSSSGRRDRPVLPGQTPREALVDAGAFIWPWRARYFHCHYADHVQISAYVRSLEEIVDRFLADRDISIRRMLDERGWIPVVSRARVELLADAHMDETVYATFVIDDILKNTAFDAHMNCYVQRDDLMVHTATAQILHGYALSGGEAAGRLTKLDAQTIAALTRS